MARPRCAISSPRSRRAGAWRCNRLIFALGIRHVGETTAQAAGAALRHDRGCFARLLAAAKGSKDEEHDEADQDADEIGGTW